MVNGFVNQGEIHVLDQLFFMCLAININLLRKFLIVGKGNFAELITMNVKVVK